MKIQNPLPTGGEATCADCFLYTHTFLDVALTDTNLVIPIGNPVLYNTASTNIQVTTNHSRGYSLYVQPDGKVDAANPQDMVCQTNTQYRFTPTTPGTLDNRTYGIQLGNNADTTAWLTPSLAQTPLYQSLAASGVANDGATYDASTLWIGVQADGAMPACTYTTTLVVTVVANL